MNREAGNFPGCSFGSDRGLRSMPVPGTVRRAVRVRDLSRRRAIPGRVRTPSHAPGMVRHVCPGAVAKLDGENAWFSFLSRPKGIFRSGCGNFRFAGAFRMDDFKDCLAIML